MALSRLLVIVLAFLPILPPGPNHAAWNLPLFGKFTHWDAASYLQIALKGYTAPYDYVFRPLFPVILLIVSAPFTWASETNAAVIGGFAYNLLGIFLLGYFLYRLTSTMFSELVAFRTVAFLAVFPSSIFLSAIYPETTFLLLIVLSFYQLERGKPILAGFLGFMAGITRPEGFLMAVPFLAKSWTDRAQWLKMVISSTIVVLSLPAFGLFDYLMTGNPIVSVQQELTASSNRLANLLLGGQGFHIGTIGFVNIGIMAFVFSFLVYLVVRRGSLDPHTFPYIAWSLVMAAFYIIAGDVISWARFSLVIVPVYWALAIFTTKRPNCFRILLLLSTTFMAAFSALYLNGYGIY